MVLWPDGSWVTENFMQDYYTFWIMEYSISVNIMRIWSHVHETDDCQFWYKYPEAVAQEVEQVAGSIPGSP